jgi:DNA (cytosine-5)-methyltransferase 1
MLDLRSLRQNRNLRQSDLAQALDISIHELSKIERRLIIPPVEILEKAAQLLQTNVADLLAFHRDIPTQTPVGEGYTTAIPGAYFSIERRVSPDGTKIPIVDLFCGTGGFSHGFELTGAFQVISGLDLLPDRVRTFAKNHPAAVAYCADIQKYDIGTLEAVAQKPRVVIGGPPCQGFSSIRPFRTLSQDDSRNNLFENFALAVDLFRPEWFVLENVVGLLTHQGGSTFNAMLSVFQQMGYAVEWNVMNAALYGLPQRRERLLMVGHVNGKKFRFPEPSHTLNGQFRSMAGRKHTSLVSLPLFSQQLQPAVTVMQAIHDLPEVEAGECATHYRDDIELTEYERKMRGAETDLTLHEATAHTSHMLNIIKHAGFNKSELPKGLTTSGFSTSYSRLEPDIPSVTLTVNFVHPASNKCIHPYQHRALTPREGARLQGFEDSYHFEGTRSQIVKQIGNAVPPILGRALAEALLEQL